jgi:hypothetical protein
LGPHRGDWTVLVRDSSRVISLSTKMVILDSSNLLNQPHGEDTGCFTMCVVSVAIEHTDEVEIQNCWKLKLYSAEFCWGICESQTLK